MIKLNENMDIKMWWHEEFNLDEFDKLDEFYETECRLSKTINVETIEEVNLLKQIQFRKNICSIWAFFFQKGGQTTSVHLFVGPEGTVCKIGSYFCLCPLFCRKGGGGQSYRPSVVPCTPWWLSQSTVRA